MKNPNRYGTVTKLKGNRRRPYIIKEGKSGKQKIIGYAATRVEANIMLAEYNRDNPLAVKDYTLSQLFNLFVEKRSGDYAAGSLKQMKSSFNKLKELHDKEYSKLTLFDLQSAVDECETVPPRRQLRNLLVNLDELAYSLEIIDRQNAVHLKVGTYAPKERKIFTDDEIETLWKHKGDKTVQIALFLLYSGFRISEALSIRVDDVNLSEGFIRGGTKTAAGKNRIVPIHSKIEDIVAENLGGSSEFLFENEGKRIDYKSFLQKPLESGY